MIRRLSFCGQQVLHHCFSSPFRIHWHHARFFVTHLRKLLNHIFRSRFKGFLFLSLHDPGIKVTKKLVTQRYKLPSIKARVRRWTKKCVTCQRSGAIRLIRTLTSLFLPPDSRFYQVNLDFVGSMPQCERFRYLLTYVDRYTGCPETIPLVEITANSLARAFVSVFIAQFGWPLTVNCNCGRQFPSALFADHTCLLGVCHNSTTPHHPSANRVAKCLHCPLKSSPAPRLDCDRWTDHLPVVILGFRSSLKEYLGCSTAELVYDSVVIFRQCLNVPNDHAWLEPADYLPYAQDLFRAFTSPTLVQGDLRQLLPP